MEGGISLRLERLQRLLVRLAARVGVRRVPCMPVREGPVGNQHSVPGWILQGVWSITLHRLAASNSLANSNTEAIETIERQYHLKADIKLIQAGITTTARPTITRHLLINSRILLIRCMICRRSMTFLHPLALAPSEGDTIPRRYRTVLNANMLFLRLLLRMDTEVVVDTRV